MYGNITRSSPSISRVCSSSPDPSSTTETPAITAATTTPAATSNPDTTTFAVSHIAASPSRRSFSLNTGMKAAVNAPSPSSRRNRFGI